MLDRYARVTRRLAQSVAGMCEVLPIKHVAHYFGLHWDTVKQIDKQHLWQTLGPPDLAGVEVIAMSDLAADVAKLPALRQASPRRNWRP